MSGKDPIILFVLHFISMRQLFRHFLHHVSFAEEEEEEKLGSHGD